MANLYPTRSIEAQYETQLRKAAKVVGGIIDTYAVGSTIPNQSAMDEALRLYSEALEPWGEALSARIIDSVNENNARAWRSFSRGLSDDLRRTIEAAPVGIVARQLQFEQVELIKSLPLEAGIRAQEIAREAQIGGKRADVAAREIAASGHVTESRATLIARTEIAKANTTLTQARAQSVGANEYFWRTAGDSDVRHSHAVLEGTRHTFGQPPEIEGEGAHGPGEFPNCRCWAEPILPI